MFEARRPGAPRWPGTDGIGMIRSMTGYSRAQVMDGEITVSVGIKSTNHRFLDAQVRLPNALEALEPALRRLIKEQVIRGHVEVAVNAEHAGGAGIRWNRPLLQACVAAWRELAQELGVSSEPDLGALVSLPGIVAAENGQWSQEELARLRPLVEKAATEALRQFNEARSREGAALEADVRHRLEQVREATAKVKQLSGRAPEMIRRRLSARLDELGATVGLDPARLAQEVAYLASRSDIAEELTRLTSHLEQAMRLLEEESEVGKRLDFLLQEMNREANTLMAKSVETPEVGLEISRWGIEIKSQIEKLREQAQNIE